MNYFSLSSNYRDFFKYILKVFTPFQGLEDENFESDIFRDLQKFL